MTERISAPYACDAFLASHGCDLPRGHQGDHWCDHRTYDQTDDPGFRWERGHPYGFGEDS